MKLKHGHMIPGTNFMFVRPLLSWERPIEEELLSFVRHMAKEFEQVVIHNKETGWFANNSFSREAEKMALAYRTVEKRILYEIKIRKSIK